MFLLNGGGMGPPKDPQVVVICTYLREALALVMEDKGKRNMLESILCQLWAK